MGPSSGFEDIAITSYKKLPGDNPIIPCDFSFAVVMDDINFQSLISYDQISDDGKGNYVERISWNSNIYGRSSWGTWEWHFIDPNPDINDPYEFSSGGDVQFIS